MQLGRIGRITSLMLLIALAMLAIPFFNYHSDPSPEATAFGNAELGRGDKEKYYFEKHLVQMGQEPLAWDCGQESGDRMRFSRASCFAEHVAEYDLGPSGTSASFRLVARGNGLFVGESGEAMSGRYQLNRGRATALRTLVLNEALKLPAHVDDWQRPPYTIAIEACLNGHSFLLIRSISNDEAFERIGDQIAATSGIRLSHNPGGPACM